jgi:pyruvate dehydrogenase E1 component alpha subunit
MPEAYHIPTRVVEGNDVEAVHAAAGELIAELRQGDGPRFLECRTYRWHKHFLSDHLEDWRPEEELVAWKKRCPVLAFEVKFLGEGLLTPSDVARVEAETLAEVETAHQFALDSPYPEPQDALDDVYSV